MPTSFRVHHFFLFAFFLSIKVHGQTSVDKAELLFSGAKYDAAFNSYEQLSEDFLENENYQGYVKCHLKMAECQIQKGQIDYALQYIQSTTQFLKNYMEDTTRLMGKARVLMANGYLHIGRSDLALEELLLAEPSIEEGTLDMAECYENMGLVYYNNENKKLALQYHEKALALRNQLSADENLIGDSYNNIGLVYLKDEPLLSQTYFRKALKNYQSDAEKNRRKIALSYANLAFAQAGMGRYDDALEYLDKMEEISAAIHEGDHANKAIVLSNRGRIYEKKGDHDKAIEYQAAALQMYLNLHGEKHPDVANAYFLIGTIHQQKSEFRLAVENYQKSVYANLIEQNYQTIYDKPEMKDFYNPNILLSSLQAKAKALEALHFERTLKLRDIDAALDTYLQCDELIGQIRQTLVNESDKLKLASIASDVYENGINISKYLSEHTFKRKQYLDIAFEFMERSKAAVLLSAINDTKAKHFAGIPDAELALEDSLKTEIDYLEQMLLQEIPDQDRLVYKDRLFDFQASLRDFVEDLEKNYPEYYQLKYDTQLTTISDLQKDMKESACFLSYFLGEGKIYIFVIGKNKYTLLEATKEEEFDKKVVALRNTIKYQMKESFQEISSDLYSVLIPKLPKETYAVTIFPDGILSTIPFESLLSGVENGRYLIQDVAVNYDYSATLYQQSSSQRMGGDELRDRALLIAPVKFTEMSDLPATKNEVREIKYLFNGNNTPAEIVLEEEANEQNLKQKLESGYKYLHFATHGLVNESSPSLSRIFLTPDEEDDGNLYCGEIYNLKINAQLVSLSACETGLGKISKGEGVIGLSRALKYAGARNLMVSLWQVNDQSTSDLMISFYQNHIVNSDNYGFAHDLRKAKLKLLQSEDYSFPYYWAPFVLVGR